MAHDINFTDSTWVQPLAMRNFESYLNFFKLISAHTTIAQGWAIFRFFDQSDNEILDLKRCCPELPELPRTLHSIKTIFYLLSSPPRLSPEQRAILDASLTYLGDQVRPTMASYYTPVGGPAPDEKLSIMYINWAEVGLETADFFLNKTRYAVTILQTYKNFSRSVDAITPAINQMMVGSRSKQACQELCRLAIESYHCNLPLLLLRQLCGCKRSRDSPLNS